MSGGGGEPPRTAATGGEFLLSLLQRSNNSLPIPSNSAASLLQEQLQLQQQLQQFQYHLQQQQQQQARPQSQPLAPDPAVAAVGGSIPFAPHLWQSNGRDFSSHPAARNLSSSGSFGFPQNPWDPPGNQLPLNQLQGRSGDELQRLGFSSADVRGNGTIQNLAHQKQQLEQQLQFGSFRSDFMSPAGPLNGNSRLNASKELDVGLGIRNMNGFGRNRHLDPELTSHPRTPDLQERDQRVRSGWGKQHLGGNFNSQEIQMPPGFSNKSSGGVDWDYDIRNKGQGYNVSMERGNQGESNNKNALFRSVNGSRDSGLTRQLDCPGPPAGSNLQSVSVSDMEESLLSLDSLLLEDRKDESRDLDGIGEELVDSLLNDDELDGRNISKQNRHSREKEARIDDRGQRNLSQRMRMVKSQMQCRWDIDRFNAHFISIYESLVPSEEVKAKQKQLLTLLERLVNKEWPQARLYLYGSCANSFGVLKSDIDVCLAIGDAEVNKAEILLKLADMLESDNLQNVQVDKTGKLPLSQSLTIVGFEVAFRGIIQCLPLEKSISDRIALTRARVPIVKLKDPVTDISCDICINNVLAVVNTKLLRDYALIDVRLRQLAFIVKHWAKSRGVNETYQGTLSSYAYVLMCIHFLQQRRPAILPCLQEMEATYSVTVDDIQCSYFDQVEKLNGYGSRNKETIAQLVWAFFNYWAYRHDYANDAISVRRGTIISKREKDWTRRVGNDRHLICIEDPFEISHDLGRVVDKYSIKVLREEFERAAYIMQCDPNPCVKLFEPYVPH